jgi:excinuclease ABC subunit A
VAFGLAGTELRDILTTLGHDVDRRFRELPKKTRDFILFTDEQPTVPVYAGYNLAEVKRALKRKEEPSYQGTFTSARRYVLHTFATTESALMKRRVARYLVSTECPECHGKRLRREALSVTFAGFDIAELSRQPLEDFAELFRPYARGAAPDATRAREHPEKALVLRRIAQDLSYRLQVIEDLGLGYLTLERSTPTLSPGELQRLRLATQVRSNLFGVVYVLDEPSAGLHPADTEALLRALDGLKASGNSLFVVEHEIDVIRHADWVVDVGRGAGEHGGRILYSGPLEGLAAIEASETRRYVFETAPRAPRAIRQPSGWLRLKGVSRNNVRGLDASFPLGVLTSVTGISGSGKSSLVSQLLVSLVARELGEEAPAPSEPEVEELERAPEEPLEGRVSAGMTSVKRLVPVDQKPIGRTPRSNLATYTGLFDDVRKLFAATKAARARRYDAGRFSFNVARGRCAHCEGEGFVMVELLFLPSVYAPCPTCRGARYNEKTLEVKYEGKSIADVLGMTVEAALDFFAAEPRVARTLDVLREVGLSYLRLGQPATELSGGEAQRIKLATELQGMHREGTLYVLDEPTTGLHPADVDRLLAQLHRLVDAGATVIVVEHDLRVIADSDWVIDMGPGAGADGGRIVAEATPHDLSRITQSRTAPYLKAFLERTERAPA